MPSKMTTILNVIIMIDNSSVRQKPKLPCVTPKTRSAHIGSVPNISAMINKTRFSFVKYFFIINCF